MPAIGELDRRITVQRLTEGVQNEFGEPVETWVDLATVWAKRSDVSDAERVTAGQREAALMSRFVIRSSTTAKTITAADRISYDGTLWNIHGIKETQEGRNRFLEITAATESD